MALKVDIIIPTCKKLSDITWLIDRVQSTRASRGQLICTCTDGSAAQNRNRGLDLSNTDIVIMLDDDIADLHDGWDMKLAHPLIVFPDYMMVSARIMNRDGLTPARVHGAAKEHNEPGLFQAENNSTLSACIAIMKTELRYDERFRGSGWEDTAYCLALTRHYPTGKIMINNDCRVVHLNEMKNQTSNWQHNLNLYETIKAQA